MNIRIWIYPILTFGFLFILLTSCKKGDENASVKEIDGNIYHTTTIGKQVSMVENLKNTKYNDGTAIPSVEDAVE